MDVTAILQDSNVQKDAQHLCKLPPDEQFRLIQKWVTGDNAQLRILAAEVFAGAGKAGISLLLSEALAPGKRPQQRIRLFDAIERIGRPLDVAQWIDLSFVMRQYGPEVRNRIWRLLGQCKPAAA